MAFKKRKSAHQTEMAWELLFCISLVALVALIMWLLKATEETHLWRTIGGSVIGYSIGTIIVDWRIRTK